MTELLHGFVDSVKFLSENVEIITGDYMKYRKPFALAATAAMLANTAVADQLPTQSPELDVTVIHQDLASDPTHLFVPVLALLLFILAASGSSGSSAPAPIVSYM